MAKCKNCKHLEYKDDGIERYAWCPLVGDNPNLEFERWCGAFKKMTNADRIRKMTDEELAEFWANETICEHCIHDNNQRCDFDTVCTRSYAEAMAFKWLQKEVE